MTILSLLDRYRGILQPRNTLYTLEDLIPVHSIVHPYYSSLICTSDRHHIQKAISENSPLPDIIKELMMNTIIRTICLNTDLTSELVLVLLIVFIVFFFIVCSLHTLFVMGEVSRSLARPRYKNDPPHEFKKK